MSLIARTYECAPEGEEPHRFEVYLESGEHPKFCPQCGAEVDQDALPVPSKIAIGGSAIARATDQTYRALEQSSAARAAELNAPSLKVTDMNDNLRQGDVAAKRLPVSAEFSLFERERAALGLKPMTGFGGGFAGMAAPGARVAPLMAGPVPGAKYAGPGHIALSAIQPEHEVRMEKERAERVQQVMVARGLRPG